MILLPILLVHIFNDLLIINYKAFQFHSNCVIKVEIFLKYRNIQSLNKEAELYGTNFFSNEGEEDGEKCEAMVLLQDQVVNI